MLYSLAKPLLFAIDPERAHALGLGLLQRCHRLLPAARAARPVTVMGLDFPNPVGLAAGLDKNGDYLDGLARLGFGFVEIGSVTPLAQPGNPRPRLFRLPGRRSLINRMGFNNRGVDHLVARIAGARRDYPLGVNIGKNLATPVERALDDYGLCLEKVYPHADYVAVNVSSPNTPGLRDLQNEAALDALLAGLDEIRRRLEDRYQYARPLAVKLSPDIDPAAFAQIAAILLRRRVDALIATNTTLAREPVAGLRHADEAGGLSGAALAERSRAVLAGFYRELGHDLPIISVGGIDSPAEARERFRLGAKLVQIYTGLIYEGPRLVRRIAESL